LQCERSLVGKFIGGVVEFCWSRKPDERKDTIKEIGKDPMKFRIETLGLSLSTPVKGNPNNGRVLGRVYRDHGALCPAVL
jgi:hypothetical protein